VTVPGRSIRAWGVFTVVLKEVILHFGKRGSRSLVACALFLSLSLTFESAGQAQTPIVTAQFNNARTAANLTESVLNVSNVNSSTFGKLRTFTVDGQVYAQPLYVPRLTINGALHNVLYVATMSNNVYAFDADTGEQLLHRGDLGPPVPAASPNGTLPCPDPITTGPQVGILSTPVIDPGTNSLYLVSATPSGAGTYTHRIFALDITTLATKTGPVTIAPSVPGNASDATGGQVVMNQTRYLQRPGLLLSNGNVYAGFTSCGPDPQPYHGWVVSFDVATLQQSGVFNASPNGYESAIWQSGRGLVGDAGGNVYALLGNGSFDGVTEFGDTFLKLSPGLGAPLDWFLPPNRSQLEMHDLDPSAGGPILTPDTNLLVGGGKDGIVYVLNASNLGHQGAPVQSFHATPACVNPDTFGCYQIHSTAYLSGIANPMLYVWGFNDILRSLKWTGEAFQNGPVNNNTLTSYPGAMLAVSSLAGAPGTSILWAVEKPGIVHAFDALNVSTELWNSTQNAGRDALGDFSKFGQPIVADGKVFVPTFSNTVVAYGLLPTPTPPGNPVPPPPPPSSDVTGPSILCRANTSTLWPPNGKSVPVSISGNMSDAGSGLNRSTARYSVWDEYGQVQPGGGVTVDANGNYSVSVPLIAARNGNDTDGRTYSVSLSVKDNAGNVGSCPVTVKVPHDQGH
jgi:PQQ-like domain